MNIQEELSLFYYLINKAFKLGENKNNKNDEFPKQSKNLEKTDSNTDLDRFFRETLDLFSHRLDAWISSLVTKRLYQMRETTPKGIVVGAYGWVENLQPDEDKQESYGYIHAPFEQVLASAVLYNAYLAHSGVIGQTGQNPYPISLSSERVSRAKQILDGIRQGQSLGALWVTNSNGAYTKEMKPIQQKI